MAGAGRRSPSGLLIREWIRVSFGQPCRSAEVVHRLRLSRPGRHQQHVPGGHDGGEPLGEAVRGYRAQVAAEEPGVVDPGLPGQRLDPARDANDEPGSLDAMGTTG